MSLSISSSDIASIQARPDAFVRVYANLGADPAATVLAALPGAFASLSVEGCAAVFACLAAYNFTQVPAASGAPATVSSIDATFQQLMTASALDSSGLCKLTAWLSLLPSPRIIPPENGSKPTVHFLVWSAGSPLGTAGVYSQLVLSNVFTSAYLLLDPTYAVVASVPFGNGFPAAAQSVAQNLASLLQSPLAMQNVALLNPGGSPDPTALISALTGAQLGPQYLSADPVLGSDAWDSHIANTFLGMGTETLTSG